MKKIFFTISSLICATLSYAQTVTKLHTVAKGETVTQIAKKYQTTKNVIFLLNPDAVNGISENQVLKIPNAIDALHEVQHKETVYGIAKQYNLATEKLYDLNPGLKENGLKVGQKLNLSDHNITTQSKAKNNIVKSDNTSSTVVIEKGETIYGIAVAYNTTVSHLNELNPGLLENGLKVGSLLNVPKVSKENHESGNVAKQNIASKTIVVQPKETIYNITKVNGVSHEQLLKWNPDLINGLKVGTTLIVGYEDVKTQAPKVLLPKTNDVVEKASTEKVNLSLVNDGTTKDLVLLLPFNIAKNNFNNPSINQNIKNDVFLNMTLDFYAGAKFAIEELKSKNYNLNIKFVDSKETNRALDVQTLKNDFDFATTDVIIGPFFQKNVDAVSEVFKNQQTIIVSPLSTDKGKPYAQQVHTMPNDDIVKKEMIDYVLSKQERVIAITDGKNSTENFFNKNYPTVSVMSVIANEKVNSSSLKNMLAPNNVNYIIYDASSLTTTVELISTLKTLQKDYKIQLVSLEKLDILESSDIELTDLVALKYTFPSVTNDANSDKKKAFSKKFMEVYDKTPSRFATRGYDVTYDVITRMFESDDNSNIFDYGSQQIENKFMYINHNGGVYNNAVYILYYDKDLTIKEAK